MKHDLANHAERLAALRAHLNEGAAQAKRDDFVEFSVADIVARARKRVSK